MSSGVEFDEDKFSYKAKPSVSGGDFHSSPSNYSYGTEKDTSHEPKMVRFLMRHHLAKSPEGAQAILFGLAILNFIITGLVIVYFIF